MSNLTIPGPCLTALAGPCLIHPRWLPILVFQVENIVLGVAKAPGRRSITELLGLRLPPYGGAGAWILPVWCFLYWACVFGFSTRK